MKEPRALVIGVNTPDVWWVPAIPQMPDRRNDADEVLLVDHRGRPLLVRKPRPVGFRKP